MSKIKLFFWRIIWSLWPWWMGDLVYRKTGFLMGMKSENGKPIKFYFQRQRPQGFDKETWK